MTCEVKRLNIRPVEDVILVLPDYHKEKKRASGVIIPSTVKNNTVETGTVVAVGPGKIGKNGDLIDPGVKVGQRILYYISSAFEIVEKGEKYHFVDETVALAVCGEDDDIEVVMKG